MYMFVVYSSLQGPNMIRTRAVIEHLSYDTLVKQGVIPNVYALIEQSPTAVAVKRYPPFVYTKKDFTFFGGKSVV